VATRTSIPEHSRSKSHARSDNSAGARSGDKRDKILKAAIETFAEHGYFNSRVNEIASRAGVADGTVYLYFKNKEQILMAALDYAFEGFMQRAESELKSLHDPAEKLRRMAYLHLQGLGSNRGLAMVFQTELRQSAKFLAEFSRHHMKRYFDLVRAVIREGQASGVFRADVPERIAANCLFGALDAVVTSWLLSERDYKLENAAAEIVDVVLNGMAAEKR
jgi:TetR/AcrR family fatty acid metabolism transcriptional regulator